MLKFHMRQKDGFQPKSKCHKNYTRDPNSDRGGVTEPPLDFQGSLSVDQHATTRYIHGMANATKHRGKQLVAVHPVERLIHVVRGQKIMLDSDLAVLYQVTTGNLNLAVRRNESRFPPDFMFTLSRREADSLLLQTARAKTAGRGGRRTPPFVFTELGVAMLSSVLNSERAVQMNIIIMRAFVRLRDIIASNKDIAARIDKLERGHDRSASVIEILVEDIDRLAHEVKEMKTLPPVTKRKIGFRLGHED